MREGLSAPQSSIRWVNGVGRRKNAPIAFQEHKACLLVGEPTQGRQRQKSIRADHDQSPKAMPNSGEAEVPAISADAVVQQQVSTIDPHLDVISTQGHNPATRYGRIVGWGELEYGFRSCHWSLSLRGGQGLSAADNSRQARSD